VRHPESARPACTAARSFGIDSQGDTLSVNYQRVLEDSFDYTGNILRGGWVRWLQLIASVIVFPLIYGYFVRIMRGGPAPEFGGWGRLFLDGLKLLVVYLAYIALMLVVGHPLFGLGRPGIGRLLPGLKHLRGGHLFFPLPASPARRAGNRAAVRDDTGDKSSCETGTRARRRSWAVGVVSGRGGTVG